jgi:hypothetical protein
MKKTAVVLCSVAALLLGACQNIFTPTVPPGPTVDSAATADSQFKTAVAQTLTARPTLPSTPVTNTAILPTSSSVVPATASATGILPTSTAGFATPVDATTAAPSGTSEVPTATGGPADVTPTATLAAGQVTAIWTLAIREYGTLPPAVPFSQVTLINKANAEAYISLQVTMPDGKYSIIEYPVEGRVKIDAPVGSYLYVAWVGGRKMVGTFKLSHDDDLTITLYRDKIVIK